MKQAGLGDDYLARLGPWRQMLELGLTTWAETPEPTRSDSHAWTAHPNYDLLTTVAGVNPASPGFASVLHRAASRLAHKRKGIGGHAEGAHHGQLRAVR